MKKRLLSLALCLVLCLGLFPFGVLAEETNNDNSSPAEASVVSLTAGSETTTYASLEEAVTAANSLTVPTATITVLKDTMMQEDARYENSKTLLTLDLNGKNVTTVASSYFLLSTDKKAKAIIQDSSKEQTGAIKLVQVNTTNTLTVESGNIDTLYVGCNTSLTIHGGTIGALIFRQKGNYTLNMTDGYVQSLTENFDGTSIYATLSGGKFDSIRCKSSRKGWLAKGYAFQKDGNWITPAAADETVQIENITVKKCVHPSFTDSTCDYCGADKADCTHEIVDADGTCTACGYQYAFQVDNDKFYDSFSDAFDALPESGGTITLWRDASIDRRSCPNKDITLNLQDFILSATVTTEHDNTLSVSNGTVTLYGNEGAQLNAHLSADKVELSSDFKGTVLSVYADSYATVRSGSVGTLTLTNSTLNSAYASLSGGSFQKITIDILSSRKPILGDLLAAGYRFQSTDNRTKHNLYYTDFFQDYENNTLENVSVVRCTEHKFDGNTPNCKYCNYTCQHINVGIDSTSGNTICNNCKITFVASLEKGDSITYYDNITAALAAVQDGGTLKLLSNVESSFTLPDVAFILDLNGKTATSITATSDKPTLKATGGGSIGTLKVHTLPINLLDNGYAFQKTTSGRLVNGYYVDNITKSISDVTIVEHTSHDFSSSDTCGCGYTCSHPRDQIGNDYKCGVCGNQLIFEVSNGNDTHYYVSSKIFNAFNDVPNGGTLKLLGTASLKNEYTFSGKNFTLDLNGKPIEQPSFMESYPITFSGNSNLTITGTGGSLEAKVYINASSLIVDGPVSLSRRVVLSAGSTMTAKDGASFRSIRNENGASIQLGRLLGEGYAFQYTSGENSGQFAEYGQELASNDEIENVKVVLCETHSIGDNGRCKYCNYICEEHEWQNGKCTLCGYTCPHNVGATESNGVYTCDTCGQTVTAMVVAPDGTTTTYYADGKLNDNDKSGLYFAINASESGSTLTVLGGKIQGGYVKGGKTLTLDVSNGKTINGTLNVGYNDTENKLTIIGNADIKGIIVDPNNTLDLTDWTGSINSMTVKNGATATLKSGTFAGLYIYGQKAGSLLANGYAFQQVEGGEYVSYSSTDNMENVRVVECPHTSVTNGTCDYCNTSGFVATVKHGDASSIYTDLNKALEAAVSGDTVTLLKDIDVLTINKTGVKLDANGKTIGTLTVSGGAALSGLLPEGYAYKNSSGWISEPSGSELTNVTMAKAPIQNLRIAADRTHVTYGQSVILNATATFPDTTTKVVSYEWYRTGQSITTGAEASWTLETLNAGTYTFTCKATCDGYTVTSSDVTVTVGKAAGSIANKVVGGYAAAYTYGQEIPTPVKDNFTTNSEGNLTYTWDTKPANAGSYLLTVTVAEDDNHTAATLEIPVTINPKIVENPSITVAAGSVYDGTKQKPTVTVKDGDTVIDPSEYTVSYNNNINAGSEATVILTDKEGGNYIVSGRTTFSIAKATLDGVSVKQSEALTYNSKAQTAKVTTTAAAKGGQAVTFTYSTEETGTYGELPAFPDAGTHTVYYKASAAHHETASGSFQVVIGQAPVTVKASDKSAYVGSTAPDLSKPELGKDYTISGLFGEDTLETAPKLSYVLTPDMSKVGSAEIKIEGAEVGVNYKLDYQNGKLNITSRPSSGGSGSTGTKTDTVKNPDGSTTKTETKSDGSRTETTTATTPGGSTGSTVTKTDANGSSQTTASAKLSDQDVKNAQEKGEAVTVPVKGIEAAKDASTATEVTIDLPKTAGKTTVEIPVDNVTSGTVAVIVHADGTEEIAVSSKPMEDGLQFEISGSTTVKIIANLIDFIDTRDHWSRDEVNFVAARGLFNGVGNNLFGVSQPMTRGMVNTVLARLSGVDTNGGSTWYEKGTEWAMKNGITDGTNPTGNVTREQLATLLYRYAGSPDVSGRLSFADNASISDYARNALLWANQKGIMSGVGNNTIAPKANAQRAQVAAMFARYLKNL